MNARIRRLAIVLALAGSALAGAAASSASSSTAESAARAGLLDCALVTEAAARGLNAYDVIPRTAVNCRAYLRRTSLARGR